MEGSGSLLVSNPICESRSTSDALLGPDETPARRRELVDDDDDEEEGEEDDGEGDEEEREDLGASFGASEGSERERKPEEKRFWQKGVRAERGTEELAIRGVKESLMSFL